MCRRFLQSCLIALALLASPSLAQTPAPNPSLRNFLQTRLKNVFGHPDRTTRYTVAFVRLGGDQTQAVVYLTGHDWCGATGCSLLVLSPARSSYQIVSRILDVRLPVRLLAGSSVGWRDLGVGSAEGPKRLSFDGSKYPINADCLPAHRVAASVAGQTLIAPSAASAALYD